MRTASRAAATAADGDLCGYAQVDYRRPSRRATMSSVARGCSAVGSASPCQGEGRGFESRHPLEGAVASTPAVEWPSGEATACKAVHTGSIPVSTSNGNPARLAQRESASLTRKRSLVQSQYRAPAITAGQSLYLDSLRNRRGRCVEFTPSGQRTLSSVRAVECAEIVALDVFHRADGQPVTTNMVQRPARRTRSASAVLPETGAALRRARRERRRRPPGRTLRTADRPGARPNQLGA